MKEGKENEEIQQKLMEEKERTQNLWKGGQELVDEINAMEEKTEQLENEVDPFIENEIILKREMEAHKEMLKILQSENSRN